MASNSNAMAGDPWMDRNGISIQHTWANTGTSSYPEDYFNQYSLNPPAPLLQFTTRQKLMPGLKLSRVNEALVSTGHLSLIIPATAVKDTFLQIKSKSPTILSIERVTIEAVVEEQLFGIKDKRTFKYTIFLPNIGDAAKEYLQMMSKYVTYVALQVLPNYFYITRGTNVRLLRISEEIFGHKHTNTYQPPMQPISHYIYPHTTPQWGTIPTTTSNPFTTTPYITTTWKVSMPGVAKDGFTWK